jgi:hypothetical protein
VEYELECECGSKITLQETAAGAKERCHGGHMVVVPSLHELRRGVGIAEPSLSPEKVIETLLNNLGMILYLGRITGVSCPWLSRCEFSLASSLWPEPARRLLLEVN